MKVGFSVPSAVGSPVDPAALAKPGEEMGFESIWICEHPFVPVSTSTPHPSNEAGQYGANIWSMLDPFVALSRASAVTSTLKLGTGIVIVPQRHPLILAKEIATLDRLSQGRFLFGIGSGIFREELEILGADYDHRWSQVRENVEALKELWTKDESEYHGKYYDFPPVRVFPKPAQEPHPPIILGGGGDGQGTSPDRVLRRVARWGDGWLPHWISIDVMKESRAKVDEWALAAGRDPSAIEFTIFGRPPDPDHLNGYLEAGADRVVFGMGDADTVNKCLAVMENVAREMFG